MQYSTREIAAAHTLLQLRSTGTIKTNPQSSESDSSEDEPLDSSEQSLVENNALSDFAIVTCAFIFVIYTLGILLGPVVNYPQK